MNWNKRQRRVAGVQARAESPDDVNKYCRAIGCKQPARAGTVDGLDRRYCRRHADHYQRHGSPFVGSYTAAQLNPNRRAAFDWLLENPDEFWVKHSVRAVESLYRQGGPYEEAFRLRGWTPKERANAHWARLKYFKIDPKVVVAAWLGVKLTVADDIQAPSSTEFPRVQAAKVVHRLASGTHKRWQSTGQELHVYPQSRGRVLRHVGEDLERAVESLEHYHLAAIREFRDQRASSYGPKTRPYPRNIAVRGRNH